MGILLQVGSGELYINFLFLPYSSDSNVVDEENWLDLICFPDTKMIILLGTRKLNQGQLRYCDQEDLRVPSSIKLITLIESAKIIGRKHLHPLAVVLAAVVLTLYSNSISSHISGAALTLAGCEKALCQENVGSFISTDRETLKMPRRMNFELMPHQAGI